MYGRHTRVFPKHIFIDCRVERRVTQPFTKINVKSKIDYCFTLMALNWRTWIVELHFILFYINIQRYSRDT